MNFSGFFMKKRVFLDYASTTPVSGEVLDAMKKVEGMFANPSALYSEAILAKEKINESKKIISEILNCQRENIYFTSGGTESNNLALLGVFEASRDKLGSLASKLGGEPHVVTTKIEHPAVLEVCKEIEKRGGEVTYVDVSEDGVVSVKDIEQAIKENTVLV